MTLRSVLARGRRAALARAQSTAAVRRKTGRTVWNEAAGRELPEWLTVATGVPFRLDGAEAGSSRTVSVAAGVQFEQAAAVGHFPAWAQLADGDYVEVVSGEWAGSVWRVVSATRADEKTARRVPIEGVGRPAEW